MILLHSPLPSYFFSYVITIARSSLDLSNIFFKRTNRIINKILIKLYVLTFSLDAMNLKKARDRKEKFYALEKKDIYINTNINSKNY